MLQCAGYFRVHTGLSSEAENAVTALKKFTISGADKRSKHEPSASTTTQHTQVTALMELRHRSSGEGFEQVDSCYTAMKDENIRMAAEKGRCDGI